MAEKKKVLYVVKNLSGGVLTYLQELTNGLADHYDIYIGYATNQENLDSFRAQFNKNVQLYRLPSFEDERRLFGDNGAGQELKDLVNEIKPDLIHLNGYEAGRIGRKALDGMGIPLFYTPHGYLFLAEDHNMLTRSIYRRDEQTAAKANCMTIACSKGEFAETLGFTDNATYVNNAIDINGIDAMIKDVKVEEHPLTVFTTGLINAQKNPALFNEIAMAMPEVKFVWIGDGEMKYKLTAPNVEVTGWLERKDAVRRANNCDVFILTSLWEGLPLSLLEAMYLKKLCIVSNVVGSRDVIVNGENGYICDTAAAFVNAINHATDTSKISPMIENAYDDVLYNYSIKKMVQSYDTIYQHALNQK